MNESVSEEQRQVAEASHLAGLLAQSMTHDLRVAVVAEKFPAGRRELYVVALVTAESRCYVASRKPFLHGEEFVVTLKEWRDITPVVTDVTLEAGLSLSGVIPIQDGRMLIEHEGGTYVLPADTQIAEDMLFEDVVAEQILLPSGVLTVEQAGDLALMLWCSPADSPARSRGVGFVDGNMAVEEQEQEPFVRRFCLGPPAVHMLFKGPIPLNNICNVPGLSVNLVPPRG